MKSLSMRYQKFADRTFSIISKFRTIFLLIKIRFAVMRVHGSYSVSRYSLINRNCFSVYKTLLLRLLPRRKCRLLLATKSDYLFFFAFRDNSPANYFKASLYARRTVEFIATNLNVKFSFRFLLLCSTIVMCFH